MDPSKTSMADYQALGAYVDGQSDFSTRWTDDATPVADPQGESTPTHEPGGRIQVLAFTGDIARHRADIAQIWGGPICVIQRTPSRAQLTTFKQRLTRPDVGAAGVEVVSSGLAIRDGRPALVVTVLIDDAVTKAWFAANANGIPVSVAGVLQPIGPES